MDSRPSQKFRYVCEAVQTLKYGPNPGLIESGLQVDYSRLCMHEWLFIFWPNSVFLSLWIKFPLSCQIKQQIK